MPYNPEFELGDSSTWTAFIEEAAIPPLSPPNEIHYLEAVPASPEEEFGTDQSNAIRYFYVDWEDRFEFAYSMVGFPAVQGSNAGGWYISRTKPFAHKDFQNESSEYFLYADRVQKIIGHGVPDRIAQVFQEGIMNELEVPPSTPAWAEMLSVVQTPVYKFARVSIAFKTYLWGVLSDTEMVEQGFVDGKGNPDESTLARYVRRQVKSVDQYLTLPQGGFSYVGAQLHPDTDPPLPVPGQPGIITPQDQVTLTWFMVPELAVTKRVINPGLFQDVPGEPDAMPPVAPIYGYPLDQFRGTVNIDTFLGYPPGTLLLASANADPRVSAFGDILYDITLTFRSFNPGYEISSTGNANSAVPIGHNHLYAIALLGAGPVLPGQPFPIARKGGYFQVSANGQNNIEIDPSGINVLGEDGVNIYNWRPFNQLLRIPNRAP